MKDEGYTVQDLEEKTKISVRNIRFYANQKLLPAPTYKGKQAYYTTDHLKRLQLIQRLRDRGFPLDEIRGILIQLDEAGLDQLLEFQDRVTGQFNHPPASLQQDKIVLRESSDAKAYIDNVMNASNAPAPEIQKDLAAHWIAEMPPSSRSTIDRGGQSWERITISSWIEINIRQPLDPADLEKVKFLIQTARNLFTNRKRGG